MAEERKSILLRIPPDLWEQINRLAQSELRSTNAQMEFLLREALKKRGILEKVNEGNALRDDADQKG
ncbi:MAG: Arc family DNA-binding protein [Phycisphaerales bacterium]|nr:Arc family DNA-binding protein [Planctomycetota bacterium]